MRQDEYPKFYCQKICGGDDFSIDNWNAVRIALDRTDMSEEKKNEILFPPACKIQCPDCIAIVGETQARTRLLPNPPKSPLIN